MPGTGLPRTSRCPSGATGREAERTRLEARPHDGAHRGEVVVGGVVEGPLPHHVGAHGGVRDVRADVEGERGARERVEVLGEGLPRPPDPLRQRGAGDVLDALHQLDQLVSAAGTDGREADAAVAQHRGRDAVPARRGEVGVPRDLAVEVGVDVDEARGRPPVATWALSATRVAGAERLIVIAAAAMLVALPLQAAPLLGERFEDLVRACRQTRDGLMVVAAGFVTLGAATIDVPAWPHTPLAALATLAAISALSLLALIVERRPRYVYFLGTALFGSYGLARAIGVVSSTPADDAVLLLVLDFVLIGVTVAMRRRGLDELATATRRFAATLPIVIVLIMPWQATRETGLLSLGAGLFYGVLAWVERNRILGTLGAVAVNIAIVVLSLSQGLRGFEMYLAPIGLCTLIIVHLFADVMAAEVRGTLRFIATGLTYAPAAIALVLQVGSAQSDYYSLGFAAACVAGIGAGVWLRVRAYLVLGFSFLLLDLGTELVRASLRNQRLGFFALSFAGLVILSAMAAYTLQREKLRLRFVRLRRALATWE